PPKVFFVHAPASGGGVVPKPPKPTAPKLCPPAVPPPGLLTPPWPPWLNGFVGSPPAPDTGGPVKSVFPLLAEHAIPTSIVAGIATAPTIRKVKPVIRHAPERTS